MSTQELTLVRAEVAGARRELMRLSSPCWEGSCPDIPDPVDFIVLVVLYLYGDNNFLDEVLVLVYTVRR